MNIGTWIRKALGGDNIRALFNQLTYQNGSDKAIRTVGETVLVDENGDAVTTFGGLAYNETLEADQVYPIHGLSDQYTDFETHVTEQDLTASYADFGGVIDMRGFTMPGAKVIWDANDSQDVDLILVGCDADGTNECEINTVDVWRLWTGAGVDNDGIYDIFDIGSLPFVKIKAKAGTVGATAGDLTIMINKIWRA